MNYVTHTFPAFYFEDSEVLILGSMPSVVSRQEGFYYMHKENRFWKVLARVYQEDIGDSIDEKKHFLAKHKIALWDVIDSCYIEGSSDSSIKSVTPTDLVSLINKTQINRIYTLGKVAYDYYNKYSYEKTKIEAVLLPSTSAANARWSLDMLVEEYQVLRK